MGDVDMDELGPVDFLVVEFPAGQQNFSGAETARVIIDALGG